MTDAHDEDQSSKAAYLVRLRADQQHPREFVGLYVAEDIEELTHLVDECCPPGACEYIMLPSGGIYQDGRSFRVPFETDRERFHTDYFKGAVYTESWLDGFMSPVPASAWTPLGTSDAANDQAELSV